MPQHHTEPSANALAHGPVNTQAIESVRRRLDRATREVAGVMRREAARREREVTRREFTTPGVDART
jgi:hypothetical protein